MAAHLKVVQQITSSGRRIRSPKHNFNLEFKPFQIVLTAGCMVLPGETLNSANLQLNVISDPVGNGLIGWWLENYVFYVKLSDMDNRVAFRDLVVDMDYDSTAIDVAANNNDTFIAAAAGNEKIDWFGQARDRIIDEWFRDDDESSTDHLHDGVPMAAVESNGWLDSTIPASILETADFDIDTDADSTIEASEVMSAIGMWQDLQMRGLTEKTYSEWLQSYGIKPDRIDDHRPELLRYTRQWSYPTRLTETSDGTTTAALGWRVNEKLSKNRFFKEPGFIIVLTVARPKTYMTRVKGTLTSSLKNGLAWLPGEVLNNVAHGMLAFASGKGELTASTVAYNVDMRDLLLHGEQFINYATTETDKNMVALPANDLTNTEFPASTQIDLLFSGTGKNLFADGVFRPSINGHVGMDLTGKP